MLHICSWHGGATANARLARRVRTHTISERMRSLRVAIYDIIRDVYSSKEKLYLKAMNKYAHKRAFFELVRFDFLLDSKMNIHLMEVNMSPNLSSKKFPDLR